MIYTIPFDASKESDADIAIRHDNATTKIITLDEMGNCGR
jgi:hypothetical protein